MPGTLRACPSCSSHSPMSHHAGQLPASQPIIHSRQSTGNHGDGMSFRTLPSCNCVWSPSPLPVPLTPVTSSSSYSSSSEVKARNSEVWRVPGNGFSSCAAPTFSRIQGISNGGRNGFPECVGTELCTRTIPNTRVKMRGTEVRSSCGSEVHRMRGTELF